MYDAPLPWISTDEDLPDPGVKVFVLRAADEEPDVDYIIVSRYKAMNLEGEWVWIEEKMWCGTPRDRNCYPKPPDFYSAWCPINKP